MAYKIKNKEQAKQSVRAFFPDDRIILDVIRYCNLYPALPSWKKWTDHVGNDLIINDNKTIKIHINDPLKRQEIIVTDIFHKAHPLSISNRSRWAFIAVGRYNCEKVNSCLTWFLGRDDRLRFVGLIKNKWLENRSPLSTGMEALTIVLSNLELDKQIDLINVEVLGIKIQKAWACQMPISDIVYQKIAEYKLEKLNGLYG